MKIENTVRAPKLADWALSRGKIAFTTAEVAKLLGVPRSQVSQRMYAPKCRGEWVTPARGLWLPVPPEFRGWGGPPPNEFIDPLMSHLGVDYYIGWLAAASFYGATHHAPQVTHVATSRSVRARELGRARVVFYSRANVKKIPIQRRAGRSGMFNISSPEATALDVAADIALAGGLDNVATVIVDLVEEAELNDKRVAEIAPLFPAASVRRVGWIVENFTQKTLPTLARCVDLHSNPARLHPDYSLTGELDKRWNLRLNAEIEVE